MSDIKSFEEIVTNLKIDKTNDLTLGDTNLPELQFFGQYYDVIKEKANLNTGQIEKLDIDSLEATNDKEVNYIGFSTDGDSISEKVKKRLEKLVGDWPTVAVNIKKAVKKFYKDRYIYYMDFPQPDEVVYENFFKIYEIYIPSDSKQPIKLHADSMFDCEYAMCIKIRGTRVSIPMDY